MSSEKIRKDILSKLVTKLETVCPYADALYSENTRRRLAKDSTEMDFSADANVGVKLRAYDGERFHEVCVQGWQPQLLSDQAQQLMQRVKEQSSRSLPLKVNKERLERDFATTSIIDPTQATMEQKVALVEDLHKRAMAHSTHFINCQIVYREEEERRIYVNRYKRLASVWTGCTVGVIPFVRTPDNQTRSDYGAWFANGFEVKNIDNDEFKALLDRAVRVRLANRITPGTYTCLLHPTVTGLLAHESFGHGMESDTIAHGRARAEQYLGKRITKANVNICDDASLPSTHGFLFFDDEGVLPERTYLVERGIVKQPITESLSASRRNFPRTANGRAESFDHKVYARMTNTFFTQGKDDVKKMLKGIKNGMYLHSGSSGMEDPKGWGVQIAGILAERVKNGKLTGELFYEASISGFLPDLLGNISAVGNDFEIIRDVGFCGKNHKEWVRVSSGGPHLLIDKVQLS